MKIWVLLCRKVQELRTDLDNDKTLSLSTKTKILRTSNTWHSIQYSLRMTTQHKITDQHFTRLQRLQRELAES